MSGKPKEGLDSEEHALAKEDDCTGRTETRVTIVLYDTIVCPLCERC